MPLQQPQWTDFLSCPICFQGFDGGHLKPISLSCSHTFCKACLLKLQSKCPLDQTPIQKSVHSLPVNYALLQLVSSSFSAEQNVTENDVGGEEALSLYLSAVKCLEEVAVFLRPLATNSSQSSPLSRPMQRKLVSLVGSQLTEEEGRARAMRAARSIGERTITELILLHQNPQQLSVNLWAAVRARGCQFLGPAMQEEVLKLILLALEDGSALSRKVLVLFVVQRLEPQYPQASKTAIGHVVQLLYRASCFKVTKREEESSLMQLKDEFRTYDMLRREHDGQIVQIATEAGLRISPEQWSSLLYGDITHKSHMQSIIDKLQNPQSFNQSISELVIALQRTGDPENLSRLKLQFELLANIDPGQDAPPPSWENLEAVMRATNFIIHGLADFSHSKSTGSQRPSEQAYQIRYKTSLCRDLTKTGSCPRGSNCTFAHSQEELERNRARTRRLPKTACSTIGAKPVTSSALTSKERAELAAVSQSAQAKLDGLMQSSALNHPSISSPSFYPNVTIPLATPSCLTIQMKGSSIIQNSIYTSPAHAVQEHQPNCVPITHKAPNYVTHQNDNHQKINESYSPDPVAADLAVQGSSSQCTPHSSANYHVGPTQVRNRGKSPSQQLEELQLRRHELLSQLRTGQPKVPPHVISTISEGGLATSEAIFTQASTQPQSLTSSTHATYSSLGTHLNSSPSRNESPESCFSWPISHTNEAMNECSLAADSFLTCVLTSINTSNESEYSGYDLDGSNEEDDFIPFDQNIVSKYGPISRGIKTKNGNSAPLQVTAHQKTNTSAVTAVTPLSRPYPMASIVPTRYPSGHHLPHSNMPYSDHIAHPLGQQVASSLPTAMIRPQLFLDVNKSVKTTEVSPWCRNDQIILDGTPGRSEGRPCRGGNQDQLQTQLAKVCRQIHNLEMSENQRLARELQSIELNIQETERQLWLEETVQTPHRQSSQKQ